MIILISLFLIALIATILKVESDNDHQTNQVSELIPIRIRVDEVGLYHKNRNRN
jgi:hypothetical protein